MSNVADGLKDYVEVHERVDAFIRKYPEGSLQSEMVSLTPDLVVMKGLAYRTPEDSRPGIGFSSLEIPGKTPYTRGSEIENCETSAWGRALAALGFEVKRSIASAEEVANKREAPAPQTAPQNTPQPAPRPAPPRTPNEPPPLTDKELMDFQDGPRPHRTEPPKCPVHGYVMKSGRGGFYCSGKTNGNWCDQKVPA